MNDYDVIVVGSGGGSMMAACRAADLGLSVLMVEKCAVYGGTTAISGGGIWIPCNHVSAEDGFEDSFDEAMTYVRACVGAEMSEPRARAFLENGPRMVRYLQDKTRLSFTALPEYADYFQHHPGAKPGYRSLDPTPFDARKLGADHALQRPVLAATLIGGRLSMTQIEARVLLGKHPGWISTLAGIGLRYLLDLRWRMKSKSDRRMTLGAALIASLRKSMQDRAIPLWLNAPLKELTEKNGRVSGIVIERDGVLTQLTARKAVILGAGGFEWNQSMRDQYLPQPNRIEWSVTPPHANTGDAIRAGQAVGAQVDLMHLKWGVPAVQVPELPHTHPIFVERSLPGCIIVNGKGQRFANENLAYSEIVQVMYQKHAEGQATIPAWLIFDARFRQQYPCGPIQPGSVQPDKRLPGLLNQILYRADTLAELASLTGVDADGLQESVARMNSFAETGVDSEYGKGNNVFDTYYGDISIKPNPCLAPLVKGPFYALKLVPGDIGTKGGLLTDIHAQVLNQAGVAIPGLYAIGNCSASVMGASYPGAGATIGPAMVFGMLAAEHIGMGSP